MFALLAAVAFHQLPLDRLRTILPNDAAIYVERMPGQPLLSIQLFAGTKYAPETPTTHGFRHLLEHLLAKGPDGDLDKRLESKGAFMDAGTLRDAMRFSISVAPDQLELGLSAVRDLLKPLQTTQQAIDRESKIIEQELALSSDTLDLVNSAWSQAYGDEGLDPQGDMQTIHTATPETLAELQQRQFAPSALALVIVGDVDVDQTTKQAKELFKMPEDNYKTGPLAQRSVGHAGRTDSDGFGEARAALTKPFGGIDTASKLAFAFAIAVDLDGAFVSYTPSMQNSLVTLGRTDQTSGVGLLIDGLELQEAYSYLPRGRALAAKWLRLQLERPDTCAYLKGLLLCQRHSAKAEDLLDSLAGLDEIGFENGFGGFSKENAVIAVGVR